MQTLDSLPGQTTGLPTPSPLFPSLQLGQQPAKIDCPLGELFMPGVNCSTGWDLSHTQAVGNLAFNFGQKSSLTLGQTLTTSDQPGAAAGASQHSLALQWGEWQHVNLQGSYTSSSMSGTSARNEAFNMKLTDDLARNLQMNSQFQFQHGDGQGQNQLIRKSVGLVIRPALEAKHPSV